MLLEMAGDAAGRDLTGMVADEVVSVVSTVVVVVVVVAAAAAVVIVVLVVVVAVVVVVIVIIRHVFESAPEGIAVKTNR